MVRTTSPFSGCSSRATKPVDTKYIFSSTQSFVLIRLRSRCCWSARNGIDRTGDFEWKALFVRVIEHPSISPQSQWGKRDKTNPAVIEIMELLSRDQGMVESYWLTFCDKYFRPCFFLPWGEAVLAAAPSRDLLASLICNQLTGIMP